MPAVITAFSSYLPRLLVERLAASGFPTEPRSEQFEAAVLLADISGFTALSERLAQEGPIGAEQLTTILNGYFGRLIETVYGHGGDVLKFAGDALLACWRQGAGEDAAGAVRLAAQCGLAMQEAMRTFDPEGGARLSLRVGIGCGALALSEIGGIDGRWEPLVVGSVLGELGAVSHNVEPGEVAITLPAWSALGPCVSGEPLAEGGVRLLGIEDRLIPPVVRPAELAADSAGSAAGLAAFIPEAVRSRLAADQSGWLAELRKVTVVFANLPGLDETTPLETAHGWMRAIQGVARRFEGSINKLSVDDKGVSLLAAWGLPPVSHEDNARRAVEAALALREELAALGLRSAIGVASGRVFCGEVGNDRRREYTMLGDTVNFAARLMQAASDDILCDPATQRQAHDLICFEPRPGITAKGKTGILAVFSPKAGRTDKVRESVPLVGRAQERQALESALAAVAAGERRFVLITGEAGMGKTRLAQELLRWASARQLAPFRGASDPIDRATPYRAWQPVLAGMMGIAPGAPPELRRERIVSWLAGEPELADLAPLVAPLFGFSVAETERSEAMTEQVRADNTTKVLIRMIQHAASRGPLVCWLEDAHWFDSLSWVLAARVVEEVERVLLVLTSRPVADPPGELVRLLESPAARQLKLWALAPDDALAIACQRLGVSSLPEPVAALIRTKGEGHPFFSEELALALRDAGAIRLEGGECVLAGDASALAQLDLPGNIEGIVTSRVDRLAPAQQLALKAGSVIGRQFAFDLLADVHPVADQRAGILQCLRDVVRTQLLDEGFDLTFVFRHNITLDVVYNLMLFAQRQELHRAIALWHERVHGGDLSPFYGLLAHHWQKAGDSSKAIGYLEKAGEMALREGAYREAVDALEKAVELGAATRPAADRAAWERSLGRAYLGLGRLPDARKRFERALALGGHPMPGNLPAGVLQLLGEVGLQARQRLLGPAKPPLRDRRAREQLAELIALYEGLVEIYFLENMMVQGFLVSLKALNLAESLGPSPELARAYSATAAISGFIPLHGLAAHYSRLARSVVDLVDDARTRANALYPLGYYNAGIGNWDQARADLEQAVAYFDRLGDRRQWTMTKSISLFLPQFLADFRACVGATDALFAVAKQSGDLQHQASALNLKALGYLRLGRSEGLAEILQTAGELVAASKDHHEAIMNHGLKTAAAWRKGELEEAWKQAGMGLELVSRTPPVNPYTLDGYHALTAFYLELAEAGSGPAPRSVVLSNARKALQAFSSLAKVFPVAEPRFCLMKGRLLLASGKKEAGQKALMQSLALARKLQMRYDEGLAHLALWRSGPAGKARDEHAAAARELLAAVGAGHEAPGS